MKIVNLKKLNNKTRDLILKRSRVEAGEVSKIVRDILISVKRDQDAAIKKYVKQFTDANLGSLRVSPLEIKSAYNKVDPNLLAALKQAAKNITAFSRFQRNQISKEKLETDPGITLWRLWRPIENVGLYIPGGLATYPSSVLMSGIPAKVAGCQKIIICTPPNAQGEVPAPTLVAADLIGIKEIYKVGGAEAIAAMTYGTQTIPQVMKIFGPGNKFVTEAKKQVFGEIAIDMPAGPSEVFIIADETANPRFVAADLLADGEHSPDSACVLVTTSWQIAEQVKLEIEKQLKTLATAPTIKAALRKYGLLSVVDSMEEAVDFANAYAPEHLEIMTKNPGTVLAKIQNAGSVFLGPWSTKSAGDYATGANHILPTGGNAKMFGALSVENYGKMMEVQKVASKEALSGIRKTIETLAKAEQLPAHQASTSIRFK